MYPITLSSDLTVALRSRLLAVGLARVKWSLLFKGLTRVFEMSVFPIERGGRAFGAQLSSELSEKHGIGDVILPDGRAGRGGDSGVAEELSSEKPTLEQI